MNSRGDTWRTELGSKFKISSQRVQGTTFLVYLLNNNMKIAYNLTLSRKHSYNENYI